MLVPVYKVLPDLIPIPVFDVVPDHSGFDIPIPSRSLLN